MAEVKQNGVVVSPSAGSGDTTLSVRAEIANKGNRLTQVATFDVEAPGVAEKQTFIVNHLPAVEFVEFDNINPAVEKTGGNVTITGRSNSTKITFSKGIGDIIPAEISAIKYLANGTQATNGVDIEGDPGAKAAYIFSLTLVANANTTISSRTQQIIVTASGGQRAVCTLNQTEGDPTLVVEPTVVNVPQDGTAVEVQVRTNTTFTVTPKV